MGETAADGPQRDEMLRTIGPEVTMLQPRSTRGRHRYNPLPPAMAWWIIVSPLVLTIHIPPEASIHTHETTRVANLI